MMLDERDHYLDEREVVVCETDCGAFEEPQTCEEYKAAWIHWREHGTPGGCSHGR